jgi:hypothetical protein
MLGDPYVAVSLVTVNSGRLDDISELFLEESARTGVLNHSTSTSTTIVVFFASELGHKMSIPKFRHFVSILKRSIQYKTAP